MSAGNYTHVTRADGTILTAAIYNTDHINHIINQNPLMTGAYQDTVPQKQIITNPGIVGSEVLATSLAGEIEQIRFQLKGIIGGAQWYSAPATNLQTLSVAPSGLNKFPALMPGGRLSLVTNEPSSAGGTTGNILYYTPSEHSFIPLWDGAQFVVAEFGEVSQPSTDTTKSPAATVANTVYDIFGWKDPVGDVLRVTRGPPWTSDTARGTASALVRQQGIWLNNAAITNGPAAQRGTYLGTVRTSATNQFEASFGGSGPGGIPGFLLIWNAYNRIRASCKVNNSNQWQPSQSGVFGIANGGANLRINILKGLPMGSVMAYFQASIVPLTDNIAGGFGVAFDNTNAPISSFGINPHASFHSITGFGNVPAFPLGLHYFQGVEYSTGPLNLVNGAIGAETDW